MKIKRLFFPSHCASCGRLIKVNETVCPGCTGSMIKIEQPACRHCGLSRENCMCDRQAFFIENYAASFLYEGAAMSMLRKMKFDGKKEYTAYFARYIAQTAVTAFPEAEFDIVTGVPMTNCDVKHRGYNQSELLAKHAADLLHAEYSNRILTKTRQTQKQHTLNASQRKVNLNGAFKAHASMVKGKTVLLCDDIRTTGSTLYYASEALYAAGAKEVYCITAALA